MSKIKKIKEPVTGGRAKVPVVMQMEALECGAASLSMIFAYFRKHPGSREFRYHGAYWRRSWRNWHYYE